MKAVREYHLKIILIFKQQKMEYQKTATKYEGFWAHRTNVSEAIEFLDNALQEAYTKEINILYWKKCMVYQKQ